MCNDYRYRQPVERLHEDFSQLRIPLEFPGGPPNYPPRDDIRIKDTAPVVRGRAGGAELVMLPWAWNAPTGKPVFNFRSEGRRFRPADRVLIPADGFYEFTSASDPKAKRKDKWLFTLPDEAVFAIAGIVKDGAFAMLTTEPGPDVAPYHDRQIVVLPQENWGDWLTGGTPESELLKPLPAGSLEARRVTDD